MTVTLPTAPGGGVTNVTVTSCTTTLSGVFPKADVTFGNGFEAHGAPLSGVTLANLLHPSGTTVKVDGVSYAVPGGVIAGLGTC